MKIKSLFLVVLFLIMNSANVMGREIVGDIIGKEELISVELNYEGKDNLEKARQITNLAKSYLGAKYVYGGSTPQGFDCSGYVMFVFKQIGYDLPHNAAAQIELGKKVVRSDLLSGDLVFFATSIGNPTYINHVGIYLGEGEFIHASSSRRMIMINRLGEFYYNSRYRGGRRILCDITI